MCMKVWLALALAAVLTTGCATSTIESRRNERLSAYNNLSPEQKSSVDQGQIKVGMPTDAVYIAWGKPSQTLTAESSSGTILTWLYIGSYLHGYTFWNYPGVYGPWGPYHPIYYGPFLQHDYAVLNYVAAEVVFDGGLVKSWRQLPRPGG